MVFSQAVDHLLEVDITLFVDDEPEGAVIVVLAE
jgi:hypothetical protein